MNETIYVTAWSNGSPGKSGAGYGVRLTKIDRDRLCRRSWGSVTIEPPDGTVARANVDGDAFWKTCPELRSARIGKWMLAAGLAPWPPGTPPRFTLTVVGEAQFRLDQ